MRLPRRIDVTPVAHHLDGLTRRSTDWLRAPHLARVVSVDDPERMSRVQIRLMGCDDAEAQDAAPWARVVCPFAGVDRGAFFIPDVDDEVLVVFQNGDPSYPLVLGGLWNGDAAPPAEIGSDGNRYKVIRSKNGVTVTLDDRSGQERFIAETPGGQRVTLGDGPGEVLVEDAAGNSVKLEASGITVTAAAKVSVHASQVEVSAGMVTVDAAMSRFSGVVQCNTLISTSVVSSSYTPGAGNIW
jgi:uncharacterized protein involved in type VI secretion and phage assembly